MTCPVCNDVPGTHATARPGLRLCASCFAKLLDTIREGRR